MCYCGQPWNSILPPPPCPQHDAVAHNGLCTCRGWNNPHPLHSVRYTPDGYFDMPLDLVLLPPEPYVGKHRKPE